jgi:hypothetical protein
MMKPLLTIAIGLVLSSLSGCSTSYKITTDYNPGVDFYALSSFAVEDTAAKGDPTAVANPLITARILAAIENSMLNKGYQPGSKEDADMLVSHLVVTRDKTRIDTYNTHYGYRRCWRCGYGGTEVSVTNYTEGTLIIDIVANKTDQLIWRGHTSKKLSGNKSPQERDQLINEVVAAILAKFPPTME